MKVAIVGKGGSGKTATSALLCRVLAERGWNVLAIDFDTNPGLAVSLGLDADACLPGAAVEESPKGREAPYGWKLAGGLTASAAVRRFALKASDRIAFLGTGNIAEVDKLPRRFVTAIRKISEGFDEPGWAVVGDLEAGPTTPFEHYQRFAQMALVMVEPTPASIMAGRRILGILAHDGTPSGLVVSKAKTKEEVGTVAEALGPVYARIPFDPELRAAEKRGSLMALPDGSCALEAVRILAEKLQEAIGDPGETARVGAAEVQR